MSIVHLKRRQCAAVQLATFWHEHVRADPFLGAYYGDDDSDSGGEEQPQERGGGEERPQERLAYRRTDGTRRFRGLRQRDMRKAARSTDEWEFLTSEAVATLLRSDSYAELIPYGLMNDGGWAPIEDVVTAPSVKVWGLSAQDVIDIACRPSEKERLELNSANDHPRRPGGQPCLGL